MKKMRCNPGGGGERGHRQYERYRWLNRVFTGIYSSKRKDPYT